MDALAETPMTWHQDIAQTLGSHHTDTLAVIRAGRRHAKKRTNKRNRRHNRMTVNHPQWGTICEICYTQLTPDTCAVDEHGQKWDVCAGDCARQAGITEQHPHDNDQDDRKAADDARTGPPAPYPAVQGDPITEQWWWDRLKKEHHP
jgi:hypothetical protein